MLDGARILLTGGTGSIGHHVAEMLVEARADLLVVGRSSPSAPGAKHLPGDLSSMSDIERVGRQVAAWEPDILINLAGSQFFGRFEDQASGDVQRHYLLNLVAPTILAQAAIPSMKEKGRGHIVNVGSIFGSINYPHFVTYSVAKAGLHALSQSLRRELEGSGIHVTYVAPRAVESGLNTGDVARFVDMAKMAADRPEDVARRILQAIRKRERDVFMGGPERFFVWMNAIAPAVVDRGLAGQTRNIRCLLQSKLDSEPNSEPNGEQRA